VDIYFGFGGSFELCSGLHGLRAVAAYSPVAPQRYFCHGNRPLDPLVACGGFAPGESISQTRRAKSEKPIIH
jgi:hypothetical protein